MTARVMEAGMIDKRMLESLTPAKWAKATAMSPDDFPEAEALIEEEVGVRAATLWEQAGRPEGGPETYRAQAEKDLGIGA